MRKFTPHNYQGGMIRHLYEVPRAGEWAAMGTGKTVSTLTALRDLEIVQDVWPAIVCAPLRVAQSTWPDEVAKWEHLRGLRVSAITGTPAQRLKALKAPAEIYTTNYENMGWLREQLGDRWPYRTGIADESTRLKGFRLRQGGQRARLLAAVAHKSPKWINLTGTPSPNGLQDLWGQTWFLDKGQRLGLSFDAFKRRWFQEIQVGDDRMATKLEPLPFAREEILDRLSDICQSVIFPWGEEPITKTIYVDLPDKARDQYRRMEKEAFVELMGHEVEALNAGSKTMKCLQIANGALYVGEGNKDFVEVHDAKLRALESLIEEAAGMPVLVAYHFKHDLARLKKAFPRGRELDQNPQTIRDWNAGKIPVLFAHPASAGHGLNLQDGGNILVFFGHWWDYELRSQIIERIGPTRQKQAGHDRPMFLYDIVARNTLNEVVLARSAGKGNLHGIIMDYMKGKF